MKMMNVEALHLKCHIHTVSFFYFLSWSENTENTSNLNVLKCLMRWHLRHLCRPLGCINRLNCGTVRLSQCLHIEEQIRHINNQVGGALMQQLSLSPVMHNDRAGGAGCIGLLSIAWWHLAVQGITTPGPSLFTSVISKLPLDPAPNCQ